MSKNTAKKAKKRFSKRAMLITALVMLLIVAGGYYLYQSRLFASSVSSNKCVEKMPPVLVKDGSLDVVVTDQKSQAINKVVDLSRISTSKVCYPKGSLGHPNGGCKSDKLSWSGKTNSNGEHSLEVSLYKINYVCGSKTKTMYFIGSTTAADSVIVMYKSVQYKVIGKNGKAIKSFRAPFPFFYTYNEKKAIEKFDKFDNKKYLIKINPKKL